MQRYNYSTYHGMRTMIHGKWVRWEDTKELLERLRDDLGRIYTVTCEKTAEGVIRFIKFRQNQQVNSFKEIIRLREELRVANADKDVQKLLRVRDVAVKRLFEVTGKNSVVDVIGLIKIKKTQQDNQAKENKELREELRKSEGMITGYRSANRELHIETNQLQVENRGRGNRINQLEREIKHINSSENIRLHKQLENQATEIKRLRKVIDEILAINTELQEKASREYIKASIEISELEGENKELRKELRKKIDAADNEINRLQGTMEVAKELLRVVNADRGKLVEEIVELKEKLRVVSTNKVRTVTSLVAKINRLEAELHTMDKDKWTFLELLDYKMKELIIADRDKRNYVQTCNDEIDRLREDLIKRQNIIADRDRKLEKEKRFADLYGALDKEGENEDLGAEYSGY